MAGTGPPRPIRYCGGNRAAFENRWSSARDRSEGGGINDAGCRAGRNYAARRAQAMDADRFGSAAFNANERSGWTVLPKRKGQSRENPRNSLLHAIREPANDADSVRG